MFTVFLHEKNVLVTEILKFFTFWIQRKLKETSSKIYELTIYHSSWVMWLTFQSMFLSSSTDSQKWHQCICSNSFQAILGRFPFIALQRMYTKLPWRKTLSGAKPLWIKDVVYLKGIARFQLLHEIHWNLINH